MFKKKIIIASTSFILLLIFTSIVKNKTRLIEKKITNLKIQVASQEKNINEAQLDFFYLTSPEEIEKKLNEIGFNNYQPIEYSKIYFIYGGKDKLARFNPECDLLKNIDIDKKTHIMPETGHFPFFERPVEFNSLIRKVINL